VSTVDDLLNLGLSNAVAAALLALVAVAVGAVCRRPALVHGLWLLVLLKLVTPPLVRVPVAWPAASEPAVVDTSFPAVESPSAPPADRDQPPAPLPIGEMPTRVFVVVDDESDDPAGSAEAATIAPAAAAEPSWWPRLLPALWPAGSLCWFALALVRLARFGRLLRFARPAPAALQERARRLSRRLGLGYCPRVELLPGRIAPMLWAVGGPPRLFVPADLAGAIDDAQMDTLLVHELAHLRRRDHWVRVLEFVVMGMYWWHPVVWYARRALREAEEQCCDAWVVSTLPGAGRTYAAALMDTLDFLSSAQPAVPLLASGLGQVADLKRRLTMILRGTTPRALSWPGCLAVLAVGAFFLPLLPAVQAQPPDKEEVEKKITRDLDVQIDQKQLDEAKKQLEAAEAQLQQKKAMLEQARANLKAAAAAAQKAKIEAEKQRVQSKVKSAADKAVRQKRDVQEFSFRFGAGQGRGSGKAGEGQERNVIRIEIVVSGEGINVEDLSKKLQSILPEKGATINIQRSGQRIIVDPKGKGRIEYEWKTPGDKPSEKGRPGAAGERPEKPRPPVPPLPPKPRSNKPGAGDGQDQRMEQLERRLEKMMEELRQMRQEMRKSRPESRREKEEESSVRPFYRGIFDSKGVKPSADPSARP
jgi:beta-lactamase regulating signal transducer with metallopeptidase domain